MEKSMQELKEVAQKLKERMAAGRLPVAPSGTYVKPYDGPCLKGPDCEWCAGVGYYRLDVPEHDIRFGQLQRCPHVDLTKLPGFSRLGMRPKELPLTWLDVRAIHDDKAIQAADTVKQVLERGWGWVYLYGSHGTAKSLILKIIVAEALRAGRQAAYSNTADVLDFLRAAYDERNPSGEALSRLEWLSTLDVLALDEFDMIQGTPWENNRRFMLMNERYERAVVEERGITIFASNASPDKLGSWYADRISDGRNISISLYGQSARPTLMPGDK